MGNGRLIPHVVRAGAVGLIALSGCGAAQGGELEADGALRPEAIWGPHLEKASEGVAVGAEAPRYRGTMFALRASAGGLEGAQWIGCKLEVSYRFEPAPAGPVLVEIRSLAELARYFPATHQELRSSIEAGSPLRIEYSVAGRFVVDAPSPRAASIVCPAATHYVAKIVVGAYRVVEGEPRAVGANATEDAAGAHGDVRTETVGRGGSCGAGGAKVPTEGCTVPLAFGLLPVPGHDRAHELRLEELAAEGAQPGPDTMPGAESSSAGGGRVGFEVCHLAFRPTGGAERDLRTLTELCGAPTGLVPHSEVLTGWRAATSEASVYGMRFEAGGCYRAFGVGGSAVQDLDMAWRDSSGKVLARDVRPDGWAVVAPKGPVCVDKAGEYELVVSVERGQGPFAVQVWRAASAAK